MCSFLNDFLSFILKLINLFNLNFKIKFEWKYSRFMRLIYETLFQNQFTSSVQDDNDSNLLEGFFSETNYDKIDIYRKLTVPGARMSRVVQHHI